MKGIGFALTLQCFRSSYSKIKTAEFSDKYVSGIYFFSIISNKEYFELIQSTTINWAGGKNKQFSLLK